MTRSAQHGPTAAAGTARAAALVLAAALGWHSPAARAEPAAPPDDLWHRDTMTGDWGGLRESLVKQGITLGLMEQTEAWSTLRDGIRRGAVYDGLTTATLKLDLDTIAGIPGLTFNVSAYQIHGRGPTPNLVGNLQTVSNLEATRGNKLFDLYLEEEFPNTGLNLRIGQSGANEEFMLVISAAVPVIVPAAVALTNPPMADSKESKSAALTVVSLSWIVTLMP